MSFATVEFGILGPLEMLVGGEPVHVGGPRAQAALAAAALRRLADARLIDRVAPHRYAMHDLLRLYARELAPSDARAAVGRTARARTAIRRRT
ncbi:hypothetical protein [Nonomuraea dietziae]|uniref:hypothetical protein n=1 Tax=Nonomuraea dietziae TaxID=65515 RepID=UPI00341F0B9F